MADMGFSDSNDINFDRFDTPDKYEDEKVMSRFRIECKWLKPIIIVKTTGGMVLFKAKNVAYNFRMSNIKRQDYPDLHPSDISVMINDRLHAAINKHCHNIAMIECEGQMTNFIPWDEVMNIYRASTFRHKDNILRLIMEAVKNDE